MKALKIISICLLSVLVLSACGKVSDKLGEQAQIDIEKNNQNNSAKVKAAEAELARLHRYYQGVAGQYEGAANVPGAQDVRVELTLLPTVFPYVGERERTLEEVSSDINKLAFELSFTMTDKTGENTYVTCKSGGIVPNVESGAMGLMKDCALTLSIYSTYKSLTETELPSVAELSQQTAGGLLGGQLSTSKHLTIFVRSQSTQIKYWLHLKK